MHVCQRTESSVEFSLRSLYVGQISGSSDITRLGIIYCILTSAFIFRLVQVGKKYSHLHVFLFEGGDI